MWILRTVTTTDAEQTFRILPGGIRTIGRATGADFIIDAALVSRMHCRLRAEADALYVEDLESTNGVMVNGAPVKNATLQPNDILTIGRVDFEVTLA